jgi:hypothetical protein
MIRACSEITTIALAFLLPIGSAAQEPGARPTVPVVIEAEPNFDACGSNGVVEGLSPAGDGFLAVRSGPGAGHEELDRLYNGEHVYICSADGDWLGVVYTRSDRNCNVMRPWAYTQPYTGPCRSGWVHHRWVRPWAG